MVTELANIIITAKPEVLLYALLFVAITFDVGLFQSSTVKVKYFFVLMTNS